MNIKRGLFRIWAAFSILVGGFFLAITLFLLTTKEGINSEFKLHILAYGVAPIIGLAIVMSLGYWIAKGFNGNLDS